MARPKVTFQLNESSTGTAAAGNDHISGICLFGTAPGSFATTARQALYGVSDAESKGITLDYADETKATGSLVISAIGATGDKLVITVPEKVPVTDDNPTGIKTVTLCTYTQASTDTDTTILAASVAAAINANSYLTATSTTTGYTATSALGVFTVTARQGLGINLNGSSMGATVTGTIALGTNTAFSGGVYSKKALWHYQISEYFRANAGGILWTGITASPNYSTDIINLQSAAKGMIAQVGVFDTTATNAATFTSNGTLMQEQAVTCFAGYTPLDVLYAPNIKAITDPSTLENAQTKNNYYVTPVILQDGEAAGAQLFINSGVSVANIGCVLGTMSKAKVNQNIGAVGYFNITNDTEMAVPALSNGTKVSALASSLLDQLDSYRYLFATNIPNYSGTYIVNDWSATNQTSPYNRISRTRTINKAVRLINQKVVPLLKDNITLNEDGTISEETIALFGNSVIPVQTQMKNAKEISNMKITIDPTQNVNESNKIKMAVKIQPTISADFIEVDLAYAVNLN